MALLEGLEAVEINLKTCKGIIDFRIDANTYKKDYILSDKLIKSKKPSDIDVLSVSVQNFGAYSLCNFINFTESGIPFLMTENVRHNYIDWNIHKFVDLQSHEMLYKSHCRRGQVLVTMAGEYLGRVAVYDKDEICSSNQAIAKVTVKQGVNPYIISTFLNSKHGQNQINRFKTITGQPNINMALIKSLLIPEFSTDFASLIKSVVLKSEKSKLQTSQLYTQAENILLETLNLRDFQLSKEPVNVKNFTESFGSSGRLDAEYYQVKYEDYLEFIQSYSCGVEPLNEICEIKDKNFNPSEKIEYKYIELANIGKSGEIVGCTFDYGSELPTRARRKVNTNDVIISSIEGSLESCALVTKEYNNALCSTGFYVVKSEKLNPETLLIIFKSEPIQALLKKGCSGTILTAISKTELERIPIPLIDTETQNKIKEQINKCFELRKQSEHLLEVAKTAVELAIEKDEKTAMEYINNQIS
ncbi:MAG: restriction endonuclease subunit S [Bacteroidales bacterium]|nr:restriction endonuclease subunit S [Bacteroidales bacterium]